MTELHTPNPVGTILFLFILALPWLIGIGASVYLVILLLKKIPQPYSKWTAIFLVTLLCSVFIVFQTLGFPKTINDPNLRNNITCGWPIPFIEFDGLRDPSDYPWTESCLGWGLSSVDIPKEILWVPFITNIAMIEVVILFIISPVHIVIRRSSLQQSKHGKHKEHDTQEK